MPNLMSLLSKTKTMDEKATAIFSNLVSDYNHGLIPSETELLYRIFNALNEFYASIGKPTLKFKEARLAPVSDDYNNMVAEAVADMRTILSECSNLNGVLEQSFTEIELDRKMLQNRIRYIGKLLEKVKVAADNAKVGQVVGDSFINTKSLDAGMVSGRVANINATEGVRTRKKVQSDDYASSCNVDVLPISNGFPGNTHLVDVLDSSFHFLGQDGLHLSLKDIIDGNNDTWFEYELFSISDYEWEKTIGLGFEYAENVSWVTENPPLRLGLKLTMSTPKTCNWLSLSPFIPEHRGARAGTIRSATISDGMGAIQNVVATKRLFDDDQIYLFDAQTVKTITLEFEQPLSYDTDIGHFFFQENIGDTSGSRVEGPMPSLENLGMKYDARTKSVVHPVLNSESSFVDEARTKQSLFVRPNDTEQVKGSQESIRASRYHLGIKSVNISCYTFEAKSDYVSIAYSMDRPIVSLSLEAIDSVPASYGPGDWLKYSFSMDEGQTWYPVVPSSRAHSGKSVYHVNTSTPAELQHPADGYIETGKAEYAVRLKIELSRPLLGNDLYTTPAVYGYTIKASTGGE